MTEHEFWLPIVGYRRLNLEMDASNLGRVRSNREGVLGRPLKGWANEQGYLKVTLTRDGERCHLFVHQLVAHAWLGACPVGYEVDHKDGNHENNRPDNLEYVTRHENINRHLRKTGRRPVLGLVTVLAIRSMIDLGMSDSQIAKMLDVSRSVVNDIRNGRTHKEVR